jgi:hypothetical protein
MWLPGWAGKLRINSAVYAFASADIEEATDNQRTTNSEGLNGVVGVAGVPGTHTNVPGNGVFRLTVNSPSFDPLANPFVAPIILATGTLYVVQLYLNGVGSVSWFCANFRFFNISQRFDAQGAGGQPLSISGEGNGNWLRPFA